MKTAVVLVGHGSRRESSNKEFEKIVAEFAKRHSEYDLSFGYVELAEPPNRQWFGINIAIDSDLDDANGTNWWGANSEFKFDRLLTAVRGEQAPTTTGARAGGA